MLQPAINKKDQLKGNPEAKVILVEYGDYQCPHCGAAHPHVQKILGHYGDQIGFVFRNFPLTEVHPMAFAAALTAEAAAKQKKFWETHDAIFDHQQRLELGAEGLLSIAKTVGLDAAFLEKEWDDKTLQQKVEDDFESGIMSGVNGTPTFFINGEKHNNYPDFDTLKAAIDPLL